MRLMGGILELWTDVSLHSLNSVNWVKQSVMGRDANAFASQSLEQQLSITRAWEKDFWCFQVWLRRDFPKEKRKSVQWSARTTVTVFTPFAAAAVVAQTPVQQWSSSVSALQEKQPGLSISQINLLAFCEGIYSPKQ